MSKKVLGVLSGYGFWGEELVGPLEALEAAGYELVFATPRGQRPVALPPSMDAKYMDPPLGRTVTSESMAEKVRAINGSPRLDKALNLCAPVAARRRRACCSRIPVRAPNRVR